MMWSLNFFVVFSFVVVFADAEEYCYSKDDKPYSYFGTKTAFSTVQSKEISVPAGCNVVYTWALVRHGTRYGSESDELTQEILLPIRDEIIHNHNITKRGTLCKEDLENLESWNYPWDQMLCGKLMDQGSKDMDDLAENLKNQLPDFLKTPSKDKFIVQTSSRSRCQESAISFTNKLYGTVTNDVDDNKIYISNQMLRTQGRKTPSEIDELNKFKKSGFMDNVLSQISTKLGYAAKLNFDFVHKLYKQCALEKAMKLNSKSAFCCAFSPEHLKVFEYCEDLESYYTLGYGESKFKDQACPLILDLYKKFDNVQAQVTPSESGSFYFAHNQILVPLLTKFGLFQDTQPLTSDNYTTQGESRVWRTSIMSPFAANFIAILYKCSNNLSVSFYLNGRLMKSPACKDGLCPWNSLKDNQFSQDLLKGCNEVVGSDAAKVPDKAEESKDTQKKEMKAIVEESVEPLLKKYANATAANAKDKDDEIMKQLKEIKSTMEESFKKIEQQAHSELKGTTGGAAGLKSVGFVTTGLTAFWVIVGIFGRTLKF